MLQIQHQTPPQVTAQQPPVLFVSQSHQHLHQHPPSPPPTNLFAPAALFSELTPPPYPTAQECSPCRSVLWKAVCSGSALPLVQAAGRVGAIFREARCARSAAERWSCCRAPYLLLPVAFFRRRDVNGWRKTRRERRHCITSSVCMKAIWLAHINRAGSKWPWTWLEKDSGLCCNGFWCTFRILWFVRSVDHWRSLARTLSGLSRLCFSPGDVCSGPGRPMLLIVLSRHSPDQRDAISLPATAYGNNPWARLEPLIKWVFPSTLHQLNDLFVVNMYLFLVCLVSLKRNPQDLFLRGISIIRRKGS